MSSEKAELAQLQDYLRKHRIEDLVLELTENVLREKPEDPRKFLLGHLEEQIGDGVSRHSRHSSNFHRGNLLAGVDVPSVHLSALFDST